MTEADLIARLEAKGFTEITVTETKDQVRAMYRRRDGEWCASAVVATGPEGYAHLAKWAA